MDLASFNFSGSAELHLLDPVSGAPIMAEDKPVTVAVFGEDAPARLAATRELNRAVRETNMPGVDLDTKREEAAMTFVAKCIAGWSNIEWEGKPLPFNFDNALMLVKRRWFRDQVDEFLGSRAGFLPKALKT